MSKEKWMSLSADGAPPGVYTPNMSEADMKKWKAKLISGKYARVEIRKTTTSQVKIVVSLPGCPTSQRKSWTRRGEMEDIGHNDNVVISMNGPSNFTFEQIQELAEAVEEAKAVLKKLYK